MRRRGWLTGLIALVLVGQGFVPAVAAHPAWGQQQKLTASDAATPGASSFGDSVALNGDGNTALIEGDCCGFGPNGAGYFFRRSGGTWAQQQKVGPSTTMAGDVFGRSVSLSTDGTV